MMPSPMHLVDRALVAMDGLHHVLEHGSSIGARLLRVAFGKQLHRALEIGEEHGDLLALPFEGGPGESGCARRGAEACRNLELRCRPPRRAAGCRRRGPGRTHRKTSAQAGSRRRMLGRQPRASPHNPRRISGRPGSHGRTGGTSRRKPSRSLPEGQAGVDMVLLSLVWSHCPRCGPPCRDFHRERRLQMAYSLDGQLLEVCTCKILRPCWVGEPPDGVRICASRSTPGTWKRVRSTVSTSPA